MLKPILIALVVSALGGTIAAQGVLEVREGGAGGTPITDDQAVGGLRDFGQIAVSTQSPLTIYLTNTGTSPITFLTITKTGTEPADFYVSISGMANPLGVGQSTAFTITFYRTTAGTSTAAVHLPHNAVSSGTSPFDINLTGEAIAPQPRITVTEGSVGGTPIAHQQSPAGTGRDFATQDISAGPTAAITIFITNSGTGTLSLATPDMGGTWWTEYVVNATGMILNLASGQSTSFTVAFDPASNGQKDAYVRIAHTDPTQPSPYYLPVTGVGTTTPQPLMQLWYNTTLIADGGSLNIGTFTASSPISVGFTIQNAGAASLNLTGTPLLGVYNTAGCNTSITTLPGTPVAVGGTTNCSIDVTPIYHGNWSFELWIANNDPARNPYNVTIQGTGVVTATEIRMITEPTNATAGQVFPTPPVLAVTDASGAVRTDDYSTQVLATISSGTGHPSAVLGGTLTVTAIAGYISFNDLEIDRGGTGYTLTFTNTNGPLGSTVSTTFDVASTGGSKKDGGGDEESCSTGTGSGGTVYAALLLSLMALVVRRSRA